MSQTIDYSLDQHEDAVLVSMLSFFLDVGIPDDIDEKDAHDDIDDVDDGYEGD